VCCAPTAAALRSALAPGGPAVIDLCPNTSYEGLFTVERDVMVVGAGPESTAVDGGGNPAALVVHGNVIAAEVRGVRLTNRSYGIQNAGGLTLVETRVEGTGESWPSGILNLPGAVLTLIDSTVTGFSGDTGRLGSRVSDGGGIINHGAVTLRRSSISGNKAFKGGGIYNLRGRVTLEAGGSVSGNTATFGGGIWQEGGTVTLKTGSEVADNTAVAVGGIDNLGGTVILEEGSTVSGNAATRSLSGGIDNRGTLTLKAGSRVINNTAATSGGGIGNGAQGNVTLEAGSLVSGNTAGNNGGGISTPIGGSGTVTLGADDIVVDNFLTDRTTLNNCFPVDTIPNCIG
jgi:hypothetical protein